MSPTGVGGSLDLDGPDGVGAGQRRQRRKWFSLIDKMHRPSILEIAWQSVARNKGAAGVDRMSVERFAAQETRYLAELQEQLKDGSYQPHPVKRVEIPKVTAKTRPLGIPTVKDRVVAGGVEDGHRADIRKPSSVRAASASVRGVGARMRCGKSIG